MRHAVLVVTWAVTLTLCLPACRQTRCRIGIFSDSTGTVSCGTVRFGAGTILHVLARPEGAWRAGIREVQLRIEVTNPRGWYMRFWPAPGCSITGEILDTDPRGPGGDSGARLRFEKCARPVHGIVRLGTIGVYNMKDGGATDLEVLPALISDRACPALRACDDEPIVRCATPDSARSCTLASRAQMGAVSFFAASLNRAEPLTEIVHLHGSELWVVGRHVQDPVLCQFDGENLRIGGIDLPMTLGTTSRFENALDSLNAGAKLAWFARGIQAAYEVVRASPLVEDAGVVGDQEIHDIRLRGGKGYGSMMLRWFGSTSLWAGSLPARPDRLLGIVRQLQTAALSRSQLFIVDGWGNLYEFDGRAAAEVRRQIDHLARGGDLASLPVGPLRGAHPVLLEVRANAAHVAAPTNLRNPLENKVPPALQGARPHR